MPRFSLRCESGGGRVECDDSLGADSAWGDREFGQRLGLGTLVGGPRVAGFAVMIT